MMHIIIPLKVYTIQNELGIFGMRVHVYTVCMWLDMEQKSNETCQKYSKNAE